MPIQEITPESEVVGLRSTRLTADEAALISRVFPCAARAALIELRLMLNDDSQAYRTSGKGLIAYDWVALKERWAPSGPLRCHGLPCGPIPGSSDHPDAGWSYRPRQLIYRPRVSQ